MMAVKADVDPAPYLNKWVRDRGLAATRAYIRSRVAFSSLLPCVAPADVYSRAPCKTTRSLHVIHSLHVPSCLTSDRLSRRCRTSHETCCFTPLALGRTTSATPTNTLTTLRLSRE